MFRVFSAKKMNAAVSEACINKAVMLMAHRFFFTIS